MTVTNQPLVEFDQAICNDPDQAARREWWLSNGLGAYASGTVAGMHTRRYHGLLVAPLVPPLGRMQLLAKADAVIDYQGQTQAIHANQWREDVINPQGYQAIERFYLDGNIPVWKFRVGDLLIEQRIWMPHGSHQVCLAWRLSGGSADPMPAAQVVSHGPVLRIGLLAGFRDHHAVSQVGGFDINTGLGVQGLQLHFPGNDSLYLQTDGGRFTTDHTWIEHFYLARERERGLETIDNLLRIGQLELPLSGDWQGLVAGLQPIEYIDLTQSMVAEYHRVSELLEEAFPGLRQVSKPAWVFQLVAAADSFLFEREDDDGEINDSVIAGYPWFGDWGRDTMIALPGLCLATGRYEIAWRILKTYTGFVSEGMLPNLFPGNGAKPEYNTVDAALWFIEAWRAYFAASNDLGAVEEAMPLLEEIIYAYHDGTRYGISVDPQDGLLMAGVEGQQLTWMDARVNGREVTPRQGKPVEINVLWYNALRSMIEFAGKLGLPTDEYQAFADQCMNNFGRFIRPDGLGLYDVIDGPGELDISIRPNQIFALSLTYSPLWDDVARQAVLDTCREHLLTPVGLRSLSPQDPAYVGCYQGDVAHRDGAYHQGTVWAWLLGHYALAEYQVSGDADAAQQRLAAIEDHLTEAGLGQVSEIFDGDAPHTPRGAPAQAWSVACILEAWWRLERAKLAS